MLFAQVDPSMPARGRAGLDRRASQGHAGRVLVQQRVFAVHQRRRRARTGRPRERAERVGGLAGRDRRATIVQVSNVHKQARGGRPALLMRGARG